MLLNVYFKLIEATEQLYKKEDGLDEKHLAYVEKITFIMRYIKLADKDDSNRQTLLGLGEEHWQNLSLNVASKSIKEKFSLLQFLQNIVSKDHPYLFTSWKYYLAKLS